MHDLIARLTETTVGPFTVADAAGFAAAHQGKELLAGPSIDRHRITATCAHHPEEATVPTDPPTLSSNPTPPPPSNLEYERTEHGRQLRHVGRAGGATNRRRDEGRWAVGVVDVQNDFCEGGSLAVAGGAAVAGRIRQWLDAGIGDGRWVARFATADRHPAGLAGHFAPEGATPEPPATWPSHGVAGTPGSELHPDLLRGAEEADLFDTIVAKGQASAAFSGFEGTTATGSTLTEWLREHDVDGIELCGIATDHCVRATAADALAAGFQVRVVTDLCAGIDDDAVAAALAELAAAGAEITTTALDAAPAAERAETIR